MRRILLLPALVGLLALPGASNAVRLAPGDGTLSVRDGLGMVYLSARGAVIGRVDKAKKVVVTDLSELDGSEPLLKGCDERDYDKEEKTTLCKGKKITFRVTRGKYELRVVGEGIDLSAVGKGKVELRGDGELDWDNDGSLDDGEFRLDDGRWQSLPDGPKAKKLQLGD
ncbi:MAG: hypothetical protein H0T09_06005 [Actinobacteria bacterium]|nr:hypothetical protein [Actinomycetota bacterium]